MKTSITKLFHIGLLLTLVVACAKSRDDEFPQSVKDKFLEIGTYKGKTFTVKTLEPIASKKISQASEVVLEDESIVNNLAQVAYKSPEFWLADVALFGRAHATYTMKMELDDSHLTIYKLAAWKDLPYFERPIARTAGQGLYAVPLVGYKAQYFKIERQKDGNGQETHILMPIAVAKLAEATHFKIDDLAPIEFSYNDKLDLLPANALDGEWFYSATVVATPANQDDLIGRELSHDSKYEAATRIKFHKDSQSIRALNLNVDERLARDNAANLDLVLKIPVEWTDYKVATEGRLPALSEEELGDNNAKSVAWSKRRYMKMKLVEVGAKLTDDMKDKGIEQIVYAKDYFSFVVHDKIDHFKVRFAFRKATPARIKSNYPHLPAAKLARVYHEKDQRKFGFFAVERKVQESYHNDRREYKDQRTFINRFMPLDNRIVYYFSKQTPQAIRPTVRQAIKVWDDAFIKANTGLRVILDESKDVDLGDIRYNIINVVDSIGSSGLLGYGPSIADIDSGEIFSATANLYLNPIRLSTVDFLREYVMDQLSLLGRAANLFVDPSYQSPTGSFRQAAPLSQREANLLGQMLKTPGLDHSVKEMLEKAESVHQHATATGTCNFAASKKALIEKLEAAINKGQTTPCSRIKEYISELSRRNQGLDPFDMRTYLGESEVSVLEACANYLLPHQALSTLVHELGHNFGLRHNFKSSVDQTNFTLDANGKPLGDTASVMEYLADGAKDLVEPGRYDVAAIRFGYAGEVQLNDQSFLPLAYDLDLEKNIARHNQNKSGEETKKLAHYEYCTDEQASLGLDPLCKRFDQGVSATQVAQNIIAQYWDRFNFVGQKYDRATAGRNVNFSANFSLVSIYFPLKTIYDQWRFMLATKLSDENKYLQDFTPLTYSKFLQKEIFTNDAEGAQFKDYQTAAQLIFNFFVDIAFTPNRYCLVELKGINHLIEFQTLREMIYKNHRQSIRSCMYDGKAALAKEGYTVIKEFGFHLNDQKEGLGVEDFDKPVVFMGNELDRLLALELLSLRDGGNIPSNILQFAPNFYDEPGLREYIKSLVAERVLMGETFNQALLPAKDLANNPSVQLWSLKHNNPLLLPKFYAEKDILLKMLTTLRRGQIIPGNKKVSMSRIGAFSVLPVPADTELPEGYLSIKPSYGGVSILAAHQKNNPGSYMMMQAYKENETLQQQFAVTDLTIKADTFANKIKKSLISADAIKTMTVAQFAQQMQRLIGAIKSVATGKNKELVVGTVIEMIQAESQLMEKISADDEKILKENAEKLLSEVFTEGPDLEKSMLIESNFIPLFTELYDLQIAQLKVYGDFKKDFDARAELYLNYFDSL